MGWKMIFPINVDTQRDVAPFVLNIRLFNFVAQLFQGPAVGIKHHPLVLGKLEVNYLFETKSGIQPGGRV